MSKSKAETTVGTQQETAETKIGSAAKTASVDKTKATAESGSFCVYIGPSILGVIQSGAVFRGNKADAVASLPVAAQDYPLIPSLIVSDKTLPVDRLKVKTPGNLLYENYRKLFVGKKEENK